MRKRHSIEALCFQGQTFTLVIDGQEHTFTLSKISLKLAAASPEERSKYQISPSGYGIHWPLLDEDLSIDGLLRIKPQPKRKKPLEKVA